MKLRLKQTGFKILPLLMAASIATSCSNVDFSQFPGYDDLFNPPEKVVINKRRPRENLVTATAPALASQPTPVGPPAAGPYGVQPDFDKPATFGPNAGSNNLGPKASSTYLKSEYPGYSPSNVPDGAVPPDFRATFNPVNPIKVEDRSLYNGRFISGYVPVSPSSPPVPERRTSPNQMAQQELEARQAALNAYYNQPKAGPSNMPPGEIPAGYSSSSVSQAFNRTYSQQIMTPLAATNEYNPQQGMPGPAMPQAAPSPTYNTNDPAMVRAMLGRRAPVLNRETETQLQLLAGNNDSAPYPSLNTVPQRPDYEQRRQELTGAMQDMIAERNRIAEQQRYNNDPINVVHPNKALRPAPDLEPAPVQNIPSSNVAPQINNTPDSFPTEPSVEDVPQSMRNKEPVVELIDAPEEKVTKKTVTTSKTTKKKVTKKKVPVKEPETEALPIPPVTEEVPVEPVPSTNSQSTAPLGEIGGPIELIEPGKTAAAAPKTDDVIYSYPSSKNSSPAPKVAKEKEAPIPVAQPEIPAKIQEPVTTPAIENAPPKENSSLEKAAPVYTQPVDNELSRPSSATTRYLSGSRYSN